MVLDTAIFTNTFESIGLAIIVSDIIKLRLVIINTIVIIVLHISHDRIQ